MERKSEQRAERSRGGVRRSGRRTWVLVGTLALAAGGGLAPIFATGAAGAAGAAGRSARDDHAAASTLYVAPGGADTSNCQASATPCATLGYALGQAGAYDRILLQPGTYAESANPAGTANVIGAALTGLTVSSDAAAGGSAGNTLIDATGLSNGIVVQANGASVVGLGLMHANLEGILVEPPPATWPTTPDAPAAQVTGVTIRNDVVAHNDAAYNTAVNPQVACLASPTDADDCGEGIHLLGASHSRVIGNDVSHNVGGILVSDGGLPNSPTAAPISVGPAADNLVAYNTVTDNAFDCGITLPGHDPRAVATSGANAGQPQPDLAGVYGNLVVDNLSVGNGGAGLLDATPYPGTGAYANTFAHNIVTGNGNSGFTLHSHAPFQDVSGLKILGNTFGVNNLAGDPDAGVSATTGILLMSVVVPVAGTVVAHNTVLDDTFGIMQTANVTVTAATSNRFYGVGTATSTFTPPPPTP